MKLTTAVQSITREVFYYHQKVRKNFEEWGEIEYIRVIPSKNIGFVTYKYRSTAEFAKEAMSDQTLGTGDVINVRWANEDPNPAAKTKYVI